MHKSRAAGRRGDQVSVRVSTDAMLLTTEKRSIVEKPVPVPLCPSQSPTWTDLETNPGIRGKGPTTNPLEPRHGFKNEN